MNGKVYVVAGNAKKIELLNSIERLDVRGNASQWELIVLEKLRARFYHMACPLDENQFLIAGGQWLPKYKDAIIVDEANIMNQQVVDDIGTVFECRDRSA